MHIRHGCRKTSELIHSCLHSTKLKENNMSQIYIKFYDLPTLAAQKNESDLSH